MLPMYRCIKKVQAGLIIKIQYLNEHEVALTLDVGTPDTVSVIVPSSFINKHHPELGGYFVRYKDGYESYSPAEAFVDGYVKEN